MLCSAPQLQPQSKSHWDIGDGDSGAIVRTPLLFVVDRLNGRDAIEALMLGPLDDNDDGDRVDGSTEGMAL